MMPMINRFALAAILLAALALQWTSARQESAIFDESTHLAAGYSYWKTGDFRLNVEHPPLSKLLASLPLLWLKPDFAPSDEDWRRAEEYKLGKQFLFSNSVPEETMLGAGRAVTMLLSLGLILSLGWWTGRAARPAAGIAAAALLAFEPTVIAHSRYVTSDIPVTLFIWLACIGWYRYMQRGSRADLVLTGVLAGLALVTKFSAFVLVPVFVLLWLLRRRLMGPSPRAESGAGLSMAAIAAAVVLCAYAFRTMAIADDPVLATRVQKAYPDDGSSRSRITQAVLHMPLPAYYFFRGFHLNLRHNLSGHLTYFMGRISHRGTWKYFPVAILVKSSIAWLLLMVLALGTAIRSRELEGHWLLASLALPVLVYFALSMMSGINIGLRHLLPIYPFLSAFAGIALFGRSQSSKLLRVAAGALTLVFLLESLGTYPNYLSFFNRAVGGNAGGYRYLLDSNLDWGQDLKRLKTWVDTHDAQPACVNYFGMAEPSHYGIPYRPLGPVRTADERWALNCVAIVSAELLFGSPEGVFLALRNLRPIDRVGDSIFIYDLRKTATAPSTRFPNSH